MSNIKEIFRLGTWVFSARLIEVMKGCMCSYFSLCCKRKNLLLRNCIVLLTLTTELRCFLYALILVVDSAGFYWLILQCLIWMGSSKSKLQISNSEVLKETRQLQGVSSQSFGQVNNYFITIGTGLSLPLLINFDFDLNTQLNLFLSLISLT